MVAVRIQSLGTEPLPLLLLDEPDASERLGPARRDALPENTRYVDTGCEVHPTCLDCPLVRCRYDEPGGVRSLLSADRDRGILMLQAQGLTIESIARRYGVSRRTVFRVLARSRGRTGTRNREPGTRGAPGGRPPGILVPGSSST
jgi:transposase-like protein